MFVRLGIFCKLVAISTGQMCRMFEKLFEHKEERVGDGIENETVSVSGDVESL